MEWLQKIYICILNPFCGISQKINDTTRKRLIYTVVLLLYSTCYIWYSICLLYTSGQKVVSAAEAMVADGLDSPTEFEVVTAIAFLYFAGRQADITICLLYTSRCV